MAEAVDAGKLRLGPDEAIRLARAAARVVAVRGKSRVEFDMKESPPDRETLLKHLLGPSGRLRAPTMRVGDTLIVGFNPGVYGELFGT